MSNIHESHPQSYHFSISYFSYKIHSRSLATSKNKQERPEHPGVAKRSRKSKAFQFVAYVFIQGFQNTVFLLRLRIKYCCYYQQHITGQVRLPGVDYL